MSRELDQRTMRVWLIIQGIAVFLVAIALIVVVLQRSVERDARELSDANFRQRLNHLERGEKYVDDIPPLSEEEFEKLKRDLRQFPEETVTR